jgi:hypothetical protein
MDTPKHTYENAQPAAISRRQHRRSRSAFLRLTFLGVEHVAVNWSEGGALLPDRLPGLAVGATVIGVATIGPALHRFRFSAEVVRREPQHIAIKFVNLSQALQRALSAISD